MYPHDGLSQKLVKAVNSCKLPILGIFLDVVGLGLKRGNLLDNKDQHVAIFWSKDVRPGDMVVFDQALALRYPCVTRLLSSRWVAMPLADHCDFW